MAILPRPEHPTPQFMRREWLNLNGKWQFETDQCDSGLERHLENADTLQSSILVPFCPESRLSGVEHTDFIRACWYRRDFEVPKAWQGKRILLHFGAVNYESRVFVNGQEVTRHVGGYSPFWADITRFIGEGGNSLTVYARSDVRAGKQASGKQSTKLHSYGCFYTRTTGIWQTVWLEAVPEKHITSLRWTPAAEEGTLYIDAAFSGLAQGTLRVAASFEGTPCGEVCARVMGRTVRTVLPLSEKHLWSPEKPDLYDLSVSFETAQGRDEMQSYFGLRNITWDADGFMLNGKRVFLRMVLDQGFNPDGVLTAPDDEQLKNDILASKALGFNGARLHQKVFEPRTLYWADRLGYLLWDELGNWGMDVSTPANMPAFLSEWLTVMDRDYSAPSLMGYCPFNETQRDTDFSVLRTVLNASRAADPTRPVIDTSGWEHCEDTDVYDYHDYEADPEKLAQHLADDTASKPGERFPGARECVNRGQPVFLSEFGGIGFVAGDLPGNKWGYGNVPTTPEAFFERFEGQMHAALSTPHLCGFCYTQLTDVEQEMNGLMTYDRRMKFDAARVRAAISAPAWNETEACK